MSKHTFDLTEAEIAFKRTISPSSELQHATLAAAIRTGKRIGVSVGQAKGAAKNPVGKPYNVDLCAYRLSEAGKPYGSGKITELATGLSEAEAIEFLDGWKP